MERERSWTPAPWKVTTGLIVDPSIDSTNPDDGSAEICSLNTLWVKEKRVIANAHLIAAAPECVAELERHCKKCEKKKKLYDTMNGTETLKYSCAECSTKTALDKAYGIP